MMPATFLRRVIRVSFLLLLCILIGLGLMLSFAAVQIVRHFDGDAILPAECGVVFGAAIAGNGPSVAMRRRINTAAELYARQDVQRLILTGGVGEGNMRSESSIMRQTLVGMGIDEDALVIEERSSSTLENLLYAQNLTKDCSSIIGISDAYHLARIDLLAERVGVQHFSTYPTGERPQAFSERKSFIREVFAYTWYALRLDVALTAVKGAYSNF